MVRPAFLAVAQALAYRTCSNVLTSIGHATTGFEQGVYEYVYTSTLYFDTVEVRDPGLAFWEAELRCGDGKTTTYQTINGNGAVDLKIEDGCYPGSDAAAPNDRGPGSVVHLHRAVGGGNRAMAHAHAAVVVDVASAPAPAYGAAAALAGAELGDEGAWRAATAALLAAAARDAGGVGRVELWTRAHGDSFEGTRRGGDQVSFTRPYNDPSLLHLSAHWSRKPTKDAKLIGTEPPPPCKPGVGYAAVLMEDDPGTGPVAFRTLDSLADNPELPDDPRIGSLTPRYERVAGLALAGNAGVLVVFVEISDDPDDVDRPMAPCERPAAMPYLRASAAAVSSLVAVRLPRQRHLAVRTNKAARSWSLLRTMSRSGLLKPPVKGKPVPESPSRLKAYLAKFHGAERGATPPKMSTLKQALHIFVGVFVTFLVLSGGNKLITEETSGEYGLLLGSMGALCVLLFAAPNSPLAQPRNVLYGHLLACLVGITVNYVTETSPDQGDGMPRWFAQALSPSVTIAGMALFGVTHPPAGAVSLILVSAKPMIDARWRAIPAPVMAMTTIAVGIASVYNNAHPKKRYPTSWMLAPVFTR